MLRVEPQTIYGIYPSWATYKMPWDEFKAQAIDPLNSPVLDENDKCSIARKGLHPQMPEPIETLDGAAGGGIYIERLRTQHPGLVWYVEKSFAEASRPPGSVSLHNICSVTYLEPSRAVYVSGFDPAPRVYDNCQVTLEHAESARDSVYWLVDFMTGRKEIAGLDEMPRLAQGFGLVAIRLRKPPPDLLKETTPWFWEDDHQYAWFEVLGGRDGIGYQYAIVVYVALHLCKTAGRRFKRMHLVAQLESKSGVRAAQAERARERMR